jgi:hypothetical protein
MTATTVLANGARRGRIFLILLVLAIWAPAVSALTTPALLDTLQHTSFGFFWNEANASNGMIKDRSTVSSPASIASVGFGLSAICIGVDHGWVTRAAGRGRVLTTLQTLWTKPQGTATSGTIGYKGLYYHFLDMTTATRTWTCELSTIDTALLFAGVIDAKQFFSQSDPTEIQIRALADSITYRADWEFMRNFGVGIRMGWKPETGFSNYGNWIGYNEAMILYILALGSPTHPVPTSTWSTWTSGYNWGTQYGYTYVTFPPLFGHQYSHCWIDFRDIHDAYMDARGITYFENSRRATLAARAYCIANPGGFVGYGANVWGLTASDDPVVGYTAHGAPPAQNDNGTITPTAAAASIAFAPEVVIPTLHYFYDTYKPQLWSIYGLKDAFNLTLNWWDTDYIGIDQGPIVVMIENYRTGAVWNRFMQNADVKRGLRQAGFTAVIGVADSEPSAAPFVLLQNIPNPFRTTSVISYRLDVETPVRLQVFDASGRRVRTLVNAPQPPGEYRIPFHREGLPSGIYFYRLEAAGRSLCRRMAVIE